MIQRHWKVLPVPADPRGRPEGAELVDDSAPDSPALFLGYRSIRARARNWSTVPCGGVESFLASALTIPDPDLSRHLERVARVFDPDAAPPEVAVAALRVHYHLSRSDRLAAASAYARAAAACCPGNPRLSLLAGRAMRDRGMYDEGEIWLDRAVILARQSADWNTYALAYIGLGRLFYTRGALPKSERHLSRARRRALRQGLRYEAAMAAHDLVLIAIDMGDFEAARSYTAEAFEGYTAGTSDALRLGHDIGFRLLQEGFFDQAVPIFRAVIERTRQREAALMARGNLFRALSLVGDEAEALHLEAELAPMADRSEPIYAQLQLDVALGFRALGRTESARKAAERALHAAEARNQHKIAHHARAVLDSLTGPAVTRQLDRSGDEPFVSTTEVLAGMIGA